MNATASYNTDFNTHQSSATTRLIETEKSNSGKEGPETDPQQHWPTEAWTIKSELQ